MKTKRRRTISYIISALALLFTGAVVAATLILPGVLMKRESSSDYDAVTPVPAEYYSGPSDAVVKNASRQLTEEQRVNLIYGEWESSISPASEEDCSLSEYDVVTTFTYPVVSRYQKWYTWDATPYKAVDTTFQTYAAIFWKVTFTKFDGTEVHDYYITEGGTLLDETKIPFK